MEGRIPLSGMQVVTHIHREENVNQDSIEIGTPGKGGTIKVHFNADDPADAKRRIENALKVRGYAADLLNGISAGQGVREVG